MTNKEFYEAVAKNEITDEVVEKANELLAKANETLAKNAAKRAEKAAEDQPMIDALVGALGSEPMTASQLKDVIGVSVQKTSSLLRAAVAQGKATCVGDVKVDKKTAKGYVAC